VILNVEQKWDKWNCCTFFMCGKTGMLKAIILAIKKGAAMTECTAGGEVDKFLCN
jgi:hypothetical protein